MSDKLIEIRVMEGVALIMFVFARQIGVRGRMELIAGYNERSALRERTRTACGAWSRAAACRSVSARR